MLLFLVYILFVIICPSNVTNVLIYFFQVLMLPSYRTILVYTPQNQSVFILKLKIKMGCRKLF